MTNALLLKKLKKGDEKAYEFLFKNYYEQLVLFAVKYIHDLDKAKELVQDLFVTFYEKRAQIEIATSIKSYLYNATKNKCINDINSVKTKAKHEEYIKLTTNNKENNIEQTIYKNEMETALMGAIDNLPARCKMVFRMNRLEGLTNPEIAEKLQISKRTVETQISKALKILRSELKPYLANAVVLIMYFCLIYIS